MTMRNPALRNVLLVTILTLLLLVCVANLVLIRQAASRSNVTCPPVALPRALPCESIPIAYVAREPRCTNELLRAMNVTNVYVTSSANSSEGTRDVSNTGSPNCIPWHGATVW